MLLFRILIIVTSLLSFFTNDISGENMVLLFIGTFFCVLFTKKYPFNDNYAKYIVLIVLWISTIFMPVFHLVDPIILSYPEIDDYWNSKILNFGIPIFTFSSITLFFLGVLLKRRKIYNIIYLPRIVTSFQVKVLLFFCIGLSLFCYAIGLGRMGSEAVVLPFHLGGIINLFRSFMMPFLFAIIMEGYIIRKIKIPRFFWYYYIIWAIIEIFAWLSKSILVSHMLPVLVLFYMYYKPSLLRILKILVPLVVFFLFLYPIVELMRNVDKDVSFKDSFKTASVEADRNDEKKSFLTPLNRAFMFGQQYVQDYEYINEEDVFDFRKVPFIIAYGGSAGYQTYIIDNYPIGAHHSSGTCGIMDPLLFGGIGFMYIVIFIIVLIASLSDNLINRKCYSILIIIIMQLLMFTRNANVSTLISSTGMQTYLLTFISLYIAYRFNFKKKVNGFLSKREIPNNNI